MATGVLLQNVADGSGSSPSGVAVNDSGAADVVLTESPSADVVKTISSGPSNNGDGTYSLQYTLDVSNTGDTELRRVQVIDNLESTFGTALFVVDTREGVHPADLEVAQILRRHSERVLVAANKADDLATDVSHYQFHELGLGNPCPVSAACAVCLRWS